MRARLLTDVPGVSGRVHPAGTVVVVRGCGDSVDAFVGGDWLALRGFEYVPEDDPPDRGATTA